MGVSHSGNLWTLHGTLQDLCGSSMEIMAIAFMRCVKHSRHGLGHCR